MKVYVAARFSEKERVREVYSLLVGSGHTVAYDWTDHPTVFPCDDCTVAAGLAAEDVLAVWESDVFLLLADGPGKGGGSLVELGLAFGSVPHIYVVGEHVNLFYFLPGVHRMSTVERVIEDLGGLDV